MERENIQMNIQFALSGPSSFPYWTENKIIYIKKQPQIYHRSIHMTFANRVKKATSLQKLLVVYLLKHAYAICGMIL